MNRRAFLSVALVPRKPPSTADLQHPVFTVGSIYFERWNHGERMWLCVETGFPGRWSMEGVSGELLDAMGEQAFNLGRPPCFAAGELTIIDGQNWMCVVDGFPGLWQRITPEALRAIYRLRTRAKRETRERLIRQGRLTPS